LQLVHPLRTHIASAYATHAQPGLCPRPPPAVHAQCAVAGAAPALRVNTLLLEGRKIDGIDVDLQQKHSCDHRDVTH
jgi:hypothetical protein